MGNIKRGVSFYSYNYEYYHGRMNLEDCIREMTLTGADGIELLAMQMITGYPAPDSHFVEKWYDLLEKYHAVPVCLDLFNSTNPLGNIKMDEATAVQILENDLRLASRLGFSCVRVTVNTPHTIFERVLPLAEKLDVKMGIEIHPPFSMASPWMEERVALIDRLGTKALGFIPDMGIFARHVNPIMIRKFLRMGMDKETVQKICTYYEAGKSQAQTEDALKLPESAALEKSFLWTVYRNNYDDPQDIVRYAPYFVHVHGKFYEMDENCRETSLDYDHVMPKLKESCYNGYICSEYEGGRDLLDIPSEIESCEQVRRHHVMLKRWF